MRASGKPWLQTNLSSVVPEDRKGREKPRKGDPESFRDDQSLAPQAKGRTELISHIGRGSG